MELGRGTTRVVTAAMARDVVICERRVELDLQADAIQERDRVADMLWAGGLADLDLVLCGTDGIVVDLRHLPDADRLRATTAALVGEADHVVGGRIAVEDLLADVDVLSRVDGRWTAGLARSRQIEAEDPIRYRSVGVELGVAASILGLSGLGCSERALLLHPGGVRSSVDLGSPESPVVAASRAAIDRSRTIMSGAIATRGEANARCRLCPHRERCAIELAAADDLTLLRGVDRPMRTAVEWVAPTRSVLAQTDLEDATGLGLPTGLYGEILAMLRGRARLQLLGGSAYARAPLAIPSTGAEVHVSIAYDPTVDVIWSTAVFRRDEGDREGSHSYFLADGADGERRVFASMMETLLRDAAARIYFRSPGQLALVRFLASCYPEICSPGGLEELLGAARVVDLRSDLIEPFVEWPLGDGDVLGMAALMGAPVDRDDVSGVALVRLAARWTAAPTPRARADLRDLDLRLCRASALLVDELAALSVGAPDWLFADCFDVAVARIDRTVADQASSCVPEKVTAPAQADSIGGGHGNAAASTVPASVRRPEAPSRTPTPSKRVCMSERQVVGDADFARYDPLWTELPLIGAEAFAASPEGGFALPWRLRRSFPWMEEPIAALERSLRIGWWAGRPWLSFRPLLLVGGPGTGKSRFAREVAEAAAVRSSCVDLGGASDALNLAGVARGWSSAIPAWPVRAIVEQSAANAFLIGDELDKAGGHRGSGGRVHDALLGMLEPSGARSWSDRCLLVDVDLTAICWVFTANSLDGLPSPLLSRMDIVEARSPGPEHFHLLLGRIEADLAAEWGLPPQAVPDLPESVVVGLERLFGRHRSARRLSADVRRLLSAAVPDRPTVLH